MKPPPSKATTATQQRASNSIIKIFQSDADIQPLMAEFGAAILDSQVLEYCLEVTLFIIEKTKVENEELPDIISLQIPPTNQTLGQLMSSLRARVIVEDTVSSILKTALISRNVLAHQYFKSEKRLRKINTAEGIESLITEIQRMRVFLKAAGLAMDSILDSLIAKYGLSIETILADAKYSSINAMD